MRIKMLAATCGVVISVGCGGSAPSSRNGSFSELTQAAVGQPSPGNLNCPDGLRPLSGLTRFGSFIGTWQAHSHQDPKAAASYTVDRQPGARVTIRCSIHSHVIVEQIHLRSPKQDDRALAAAVNELPMDANQVYDHQHPGCRTLQYQSSQLAKALGADDPQGVVGIELEGDTAAYDPSAVTTVLMDIVDPRAEDSQGC